MPKNPKLRGERAECAFVLAALEHGLAVSKPWGDSCAYDAIVDNGRRLFRVQVRSVGTLSGRGYQSHAIRSHWRVPLGPHDADIFAVLVIPAKAWYLIPLHRIAPKRTVRLFPHIPHSTGKWEPYRDAWHLLARCPRGGERGSLPGPG